MPFRLIHFWWLYFSEKYPSGDALAAQEYVLEKGSLSECYYFARLIPGADTKAFERRILDSTSYEEMYKFARDVPGADLPALLEKVLEGNDYEVMFSFALYIVTSMPGREAYLQRCYDVLKPHLIGYKLKMLENTLRR